MKGMLTLTIITQRATSLNYGENIGNVSILKKLSLSLFKGIIKLYTVIMCGLKNITSKTKSLADSHCRFQFSITYGF